MTTRHLYIYGLDPGGGELSPGGASGWAWLMVPRMCIFGDEPSQIIEWDYGEYTGSLARQALAIATQVRELQGLEYKTGPAIMCEAWDQDPQFKVTDPEALSPVRLGAMLELLQEQKKLGDSTLHFQSRTLPMSSKATTDEKLKKYGLYVQGSDHIRMATKHALIGLRRAAEDPFTFGLKLWPYPPNGVS